MALILASLDVVELSCFDMATSHTCGSLWECIRSAGEEATISKSNPATFSV